VLRFDEGQYGINAWLPRIIQGDAPSNRLVITEFPDMAQF